MASLFRLHVCLRITIRLGSVADALSFIVLVLLWRRIFLVIGGEVDEI
jgi:hypothetical protein